MEMLPPSSKVNGLDRTHSNLELKQADALRDDLREGLKTLQNLDLSSPTPPTGVSIMPTKRPLMTHTVRVLTPDEVRSLEPVFRQNGAELPDPAFSCVIGAIDGNGKVTNNFIVGQLRMHAEPLHLEPGGEHLFRPLARALYDEIARRVGTVDVFLFAPEGPSAKMAEAVGMDREPWIVYSTRVYGNPVGPGTGAGANSNSEDYPAPLPDETKQ